MKIQLNVGDIVRVGKFLNKKVTIKSFGKDDKGQPTIKTEDGKEYKALKMRVEKWMKADLDNMALGEIKVSASPYKLRWIRFEKEIRWI